MHCRAWPIISDICWLLSKIYKFADKRSNNCIEEAGLRARNSCGPYHALITDPIVIWCPSMK